MRGDQDPGPGAAPRPAAGRRRARSEGQGGAGFGFFPRAYLACGGVHGVRMREEGENAMHFLFLAWSE